VTVEAREAALSELRAYWREPGGERVSQERAEYYMTYARQAAHRMERAGGDPYMIAGAVARQSGLPMKDPPPERKLGWIQTPNGWEEHEFPPDTELEDPREDEF
jgi:hypothetical protein